MTYEPLHHKYRPQTFKDLVGQDAIANTLINAINREKIAPAYLFTGPRGTGKTSSARILAKSLNCLHSNKPTPEPCGQCEVCRAIARGSALDVIEIDAASNTGVDNIREIIERAQFAPVQCRYKVYVIDECHMLSVAAFNALLKTLEEPPDRVIFVLATTDPQRVLPTIISRCQRFDYRRIPLDAMVNHLKTIAHKENIPINDEALILVAQIANGGLRDAESLLDQLSLLSDTITPDRVWELVGAIPEKDLLKLIQLIPQNNTELLIDQCRHLVNRGKEPLVVLQNLASFYLNLLIAHTAPNRSDMVTVTAPTWQELCQEAQKWSIQEILRGQKHLKDSEAQLRNTTQPRLWLEVTLLGLLPIAVPPQVVIQETPTIRQIDHTPTTPTQPVVKTQSSPQPQTSQIPEPVVISNPSTETTPATPVSHVSPPQDLSDLSQIWQTVLEHTELLTTKSLFSQHGHLIGLEDSVAIVGISSEKLMPLCKGKDRIAGLEAAFKVVFKRHIHINLQLSKPNQPPETTTLKPASPPSKPLNSNPQPPQIQSPSEGVNQTPSTPNGHYSQPAPSNLPPESHPQTSSKEPTEADIKKAVESLLKSFEGELVSIDSEEIFPLDTPISSTSNGHQDRHSDENPQESQKPFSLKNQPSVTGRPDLSGKSEDDLDF